MKIKQLRLSGFGPYKDEQHVDFEAFDDDGIFLITGKTGAGKSTILDAICYALFSSVPRYENTQPKLRSDHCAPGDPTWVELEFIVNHQAYKVRRSPEYDKPKRYGAGTTRAVATAELSRRVGETWEAFAARPVDVGRELGQIIGLTKDQFLRVILLAQNRFHHFLQSDIKDRQEVLRTLFGTDRFRQVEEALLSKRKILEDELSAGSSKVDQWTRQAADLLGVDEPTTGDAVWFVGVGDALGDEVAVAFTAATKANDALVAADKEYWRRQALRGHQVRRDAAAERLRALADVADDIDRRRAVVKAAIGAAAVWPHVAAKKASAKGLIDAQGVEQTARTAYPDRAATAEVLLTAVDEITRQLGSLKDAVSGEKELPALTADVNKNESALAAAQSSIDMANASAEQLPAQIEKAAIELTETRVVAAREPSAAETVQRLDRMVAAARSLANIDDQLTEANGKYRSASDAVMAALARERALTEQRLTGHAFELAAELVCGEPCAVCGSPDHPAPAQSEAAPITLGDIKVVREEVSRLTQDLDVAKDRVGEFSTKAATTRAIAGDQQCDELEHQLDEARQTHSEAQTALGRVKKLEGEIHSMNRQQDVLKEELSALTESLGSVSASVVMAKVKRDSMIARVSEQRGNFETVEGRHWNLTDKLRNAQTLAAAISRVADRETELERATSVLTAQLAEHQFTDEIAVEHARCTELEIEAAEASIRSHGENVAAARATLAEPELAELPTEPIDTDDSGRAKVQSVRDAAYTLLDSLTERSANLGRIVAAACKELAAAGTLRTEFDAINGLACVIRGDEPNTRRMKLETYVLAAQLEEIVAAANARLSVMTSGRYTLEHDDSLQYRRKESGLGLTIFDAHTGRARATHSLSGGETFLASLALALGLAEVVTNQAGGISLDTLFIDEGFGSLDTETLDIAMGTLDSLRAGGRSIGLISHVGSMKEQIHATLQIRTDSSGHSHIFQGQLGPDH